MGIRAEEGGISHEDVVDGDQIGAILFSEAVELQFLFGVDVLGVDGEGEVSSTGADLQPDLHRPLLLQHHPLVTFPGSYERTIFL